jgi:ATP-dependent DNA helicase RecG
MLTTRELELKLAELRTLTAETEVVEFKEAKNNYDFIKLGKYFSALCNEANLKDIASAWLVFGIRDKDKAIVNSQFRPNKADLDSLKAEIANKTTNRITFVEIYELDFPEGRVVLFEIPAAPKGIPIAWEGNYYGRDGEELQPLNLEELERIRFPNIEDWSAVICPDATIDDLDPKALEVARKNYAVKYPEYATEVEIWNDLTFLNKAKLTKQGKITRTAIILLGKTESEHFINPSEAKIRWILKDSQGNDKDYYLAELPLLLAVDKIYDKIRKLTYRYIKEGTLFPDEVPQYEPYLIREAINNCIAHQDYSKGGGRINVIEKEDDQLIFSNIGTFIPGSVEKVVINDAPELKYRNPFLAHAMFNLRMVDTMGGGIRKMFNFQRVRFFPMPEYEFEKGIVKVTIIGKILDMDYARVLAKNQDLTLEEIVLLDKVQKKKDLNDIEEKHLRKRKLIEGRKPNFYVSKEIAQILGQKADYTKNRAFDNTYYMDLIIKFIEQHGQMERKEADELLWTKLPDWMNEEQKRIRTNNLIAELRKINKIKNIGIKSKPQWILLKD